MEREIIINNVCYKTGQTRGINKEKFILFARPLSSRIDEIIMWTPGYGYPYVMKTKGLVYEFNTEDLIEAFKVLYPSVDFTGNTKCQMPGIKTVEPTISKTMSREEKVAELLLRNQNATMTTLKKVLSMTKSDSILEQIIVHPACTEELAIEIADMMFNNQADYIEEVVDIVSEELEVIVDEPIVNKINKKIEFKSRAIKF